MKAAGAACVFGGKLTALRYPEREFVSVAAGACYYEPIKPLAAKAELRDDMLNIDDVTGRLSLQTRRDVKLLLDKFFYL